VIVYSPMQSGLLSGSFSAERAASLPANDWRSRNSDFKGEALKRNLIVAETMREIASQHRTTVAAVAVAWTLAWPGVTGAIVGARKPSQVDGWLDAATLSLSASEIEAIATSIEQNGVGSGPARLM
jgi:aryl-alcohol dehydrogenase-like predicted oxidoreductase